MNVFIKGYYHAVSSLSRISQGFPKDSFSVLFTFFGSLRALIISTFSKAIHKQILKEVNPVFYR